MSTHACYLAELTPAKFPATLRRISTLILREYPDCNMVAGTGLSGVMLLPALAAKLKIEWAIVRKMKDDSHSALDVEISKMPENGPRIVIIDDLVSTGSTARKVIGAIAKSMKKTTLPFQILGGALYDQRADDIVDNVAFIGARHWPKRKY